MLKNKIFLHLQCHAKVVAKRGERAQKRVRASKRPNDKAKDNSDNTLGKCDEQRSVKLSKVSGVVFFPPYRHAAQKMFVEKDHCDGHKPTISTLFPG